MFKKIDELINTVARKIKQNKLSYQPQALKELYYIYYVEDKPQAALKQLKEKLQQTTKIIKEIGPINQSVPKGSVQGSNLTLWLNKKTVNSQQTLDEQIMQTGESSFGNNGANYLLLDNQLLQEVKAPYRTVLLDSTMDLAKNYDKWLEPKNDYEMTIVNIFKQIGQCLLLINVQDGTYLAALPSAALLKYPDQKMIKAKYHLTADVPPLYSSTYNEDQYDLTSNCINVTVKQLELLVKPVKLTRIAGYPQYRLNIERFHFSKYSGLQKYNYLTGDYYSEVKVKNNLSDIELVLTAKPNRKDKKWRHAIKRWFNTTGTDTLRTDLCAYLDMEIIWEIDPAGNFKLKTIDHLPYWDKILKQYQTNDLAHLQEHFFKCNRDLAETADNDFLTSIFIQGFLTLNLRDSRQLYQMFKWPKDTAFQVEPLKLTTKAQTTKTLKPLMPAQGLNQLIKTLNQGLTFYYQNYLFNLKKHSLLGANQTLSVKEVKL